MIFGIVTDQCVETAVRDGCDKGFLMGTKLSRSALFSMRKRASSMGSMIEYVIISSTNGC